MSNTETTSYSLREALAAFPEQKGKLYIIFKPTPNNNALTEVNHGVKVRNIHRLLGRRSMHHIFSAWLSIPAEPVQKKHRLIPQVRTVNLIKHEELGFEIPAVPTRKKPVSRTKDKWSSPMRVKGVPHKSKKN